MLFLKEWASEKDQWREYRTEKYTQDVIFTEVIVFNKCLTMTFQLVQWTEMNQVSQESPENTK